MADEDLIRGWIQPTTPTARELAMVLFRQRRVFVGAFVVIFVAAVLYAVFGTTYQAKMKVLVRRGRADAPITAGENAPLDLTRIATTEEDLNSEVELLRDDEVMRTVVEETGAGGRDWLHILYSGESRAEDVERRARRLARKIRVEPVKKTNLIAIDYSSPDPQVAAKVLHSLAAVYLEKHMAVHRPDGESHFFEQQAAESKQQLEDAKQRLLQFTAGHGVVSAAQQRDLALEKLSELDISARQAKIDLAETQQRIQVLADQLSRLPERTTTQVHTADNPELLKADKSSLLDLQLKRTQLLTKFEPTHRLVREVDQQIAQAQAAIAGESAAPVRDETTDKNPQFEWAKSELQRAQVQLKGLNAREAATRAQASAYREMSARLGDDAVTQEELIADEKAAEENHLLYVKKQEEARMADALDKRGIVNVAIAEQPVAPALPVWSAWMVVALGLVAAGGVGTGAAFTADYLNTAFRNPDEVLMYLNAPVLASLPRSVRGRLTA
ncbi:MAG TPA: hypothetical protein VHW45_14080 [Candidatus Sulfotelmatobacter sp.]|jgi:uncharacterized protein involved in exopolysaccharide biosynthesis|nr:hypothetical protein [Candidatus Sulfotelmatobacter sp.]